MVVSARVPAIDRFGHRVLRPEGFSPGAKARQSIPAAPGGWLIHPPFKTILNSALVISAVTLADGSLTPPHRSAPTVGR
jgi:hypothetical protein